MQLLDLILELSYCGMYGHGVRLQFDWEMDCLQKAVAIC